MTTARILPGTTNEIESAKTDLRRPVIGRDRALIHYPAGMMGRLPQCGN